MQPWTKPELPYLQATYNRPRTKVCDDVYVATVRPVSAPIDVVPQDALAIFKAIRLRKGQLS